MIQDLAQPNSLIRIEIKTTLEESNFGPFIKYSIHDEPGRTEFIFSHNFMGDLGKIRLQVLPNNECRFTSFNPAKPSRYDGCKYLYSYHFLHGNPFHVFQYLVDREELVNEIGGASFLSMELNQEINDGRLELGENAKEIIKEAMKQIDFILFQLNQMRSEAYQYILDLIISNLRQHEIWPNQEINVRKGKIGRPRNIDDDWAYTQVRLLNREPKEVYPEWLSRIGFRENTLADPRDSFNKAIKPRKLKKGEETD
jgi:PIN domain nuclease of toxin-antitoxin system